MKLGGTGKEVSVMIQLNKRVNIRLFSRVCLIFLIIWSVQIIAEMIWKGGPSTPLIQALGLAFCVFGVALGAFTDKENRLPVYGLILSALLPLPVAVGVILLGML